MPRAEDGADTVSAPAGDGTCGSQRRPTTVFIEISGLCNGRCPYCARQRFAERFAGSNMSTELFRRIVEHLLDLQLLRRGQPQPVHLYNWGDPFLNPDINAILDILRERSLSASVSSNFIHLPNIEADLLRTLSEVRFSLSGFSQTSYSRIHGATLRNTLVHFDHFYEQLRRYAPATHITVAWHRYKFNEGELWEAYRNFARPGIVFHPEVATLNDLPEFLQFASGQLSADRLEQASHDLFIEHISRELARHRRKSRHYRCFMLDYLVIDETGQLLLCCGMTRFDQNHVLGSILDMRLDDIWNRKNADPVCTSCTMSGTPRSALLMRHPPLPPGGRTSDRIRLWTQLHLFSGWWVYQYSRLNGLIRHCPGGEQVIRLLKKVRNRIGGRS